VLSTAEIARIDVSDLGLETWDLGLRTWDLGLGTPCEPALTNSQSLGKICGGQGGMSVQFCSAQQLLYAFATLSLYTLSNSNSLARIEVISLLYSNTAALGRCINLIITYLLHKEEDVSIG
jgi:hypothetical protein